MRCLVGLCVKFVQELCESIIMCKLQRVSGGLIGKAGPRRTPVDASTLVPARSVACVRTVVNAEASGAGSGAICT